jgi:hypothetical protein
MENPESRRGFSRHENGLTNRWLYFTLTFTRGGKKASQFLATKTNYILLCIYTFVCIVVCLLLLQKVEAFEAKRQRNRQKLICKENLSFLVLLIKASLLRKISLD